MIQNHKQNSFKIINFRLKFSILLLPNHCILHLIQCNFYIYINPTNLSCNNCTPLCQSHLNSSILHTFINQHIDVFQCTNFSMNIRTNSSPYINSNINTLYTFINQYITISLYIDLQMYIDLQIYINLSMSLMTINLLLLEPPI